MDYNQLADGIELVGVDGQWWSLAQMLTNTLF